MSLSEMLPLNDSPGNILSYKSQLQKCGLEVKYVIFCHFLDAILNYTKSIIIQEWKIVTADSLTTSIYDYTTKSSFSDDYEAGYAQIGIYGDFGNFDGGHFENRPCWQFCPNRSVTC